jgi:hypothetical protein
MVPDLIGRNPDPAQTPSLGNSRANTYEFDIDRCAVLDVEVIPNSFAVSFGSVRDGRFRLSYAETSDSLRKHLEDALARKITLVGFNSSANTPRVKAIPDGYNPFEVSQAVVSGGRNGHRQTPPYRYPNHIDQVERADREPARRGI